MPIIDFMVTIVVPLTLLSYMINGAYFIIQEALEDRKQELIEEFGVGSDPVLEQESRIMDKKRDIEAAKKEHKKQ